MKRLLTVTMVIALVACMTGTVWATLGSHSVGVSEGECAICHNTSATAKSRGWGMTITTLATGWLTRPIAKLCYSCHDNTKGSGAHDMATENLAFNANNHGFGATRVVYSEGTWSGTANPENYSATNLPYTAAQIDCTTCHNVHVSEIKPFSMRGTTTGNFDALCIACHGRANSTVVGTNNNVGDGATSLHPTGVAFANLTGNDPAVGKVNKFLATMDARMTVVVPANWSLGGHLVNPGVSSGANFSCQTCHPVHGVPGVVGITELLAINSVNIHATGDGAAARTICTGCHGNPWNAGTLTVASGSDHPIDGNVGRAFYPPAWQAWTTNKVPTSWQTAARPTGMYGATAIPLANDQPACSSCHDTHGGIGATSLLYGPQPAGVTDWCFSCHSEAGILPIYHHSVQGNWASSLVYCGDCHGTGAGCQNGIWMAHNGFWSFRTAISSTDSAFCEACHIATNPTSFTATSNCNVAFTADLMPAHHGAAFASLGGDSHSVDVNTPALSNIVKYSGNWAGLANGPYDDTTAPHVAGVVSEWNAGATLCESCHNILENVGNRAVGGTLTGGWEANLLLLSYEDNPAGVGVADSPNNLAADDTLAASDAFCRVCHTDGSTGYVHYPAAHTVASYNYGSVTPFGRTTATVMTTPNAPPTSCPEVSTADATGAPGVYSYPQANALNCDSCHRPHDGFSADTTVGGGETSHVIVQSNTATVTPKTSACAPCHNVAIQCGQ